MRSASVLPFVVTLLGVASAVPSPHSDIVVHETRVSATHWTKTGRLDSTEVLPMRFGLIQQNLHKLEEMLMSVSHPESPKYAQHFTPMEVIDAFAPSEETVSAVTNWLVDSGFPRDRLRLSANKGWIHLNASTSEVESLLNTEYHVYTHPSGDTQIGCHNYSLPRHLQQHVDLIKPTVHHNRRTAPNTLLKRAGDLGQPSSGSSPNISGSYVTITSSLQYCSVLITPQCLRALYNFNYTPSSTDNNSFGIVEFTPQAYLASDLDMFFRNFSPSQVGVRPKAVFIDGAIIQTTNQGFDFNGKSSINLEYGMSLTSPQQVTLLQVGDQVEAGGHGGLDNWLDAVDASYCGGDDPSQNGKYPDPINAPGAFNGSESCGIIKPPNVISVSFGEDEALISPVFARRQCSEYGKLGLLGTSVIYSSGDRGVAGGINSSIVCLNSEHQEDANGSVFNPTFPSTCPFVTSVGATQMNQGSTVDDPEVAFVLDSSNWSIYYSSGGGFSNIFPLPMYQKSAVEQYSQKYLNPSPFASGQYNDSGNARAYPDISANGANYVVAIDGQFTLNFGTSPSTPVIASMITMINDARIAAGKNTVGFLNPTIYNSSFSYAFNDITSGSNPGCGTDGFSATSGWDPVTGVGTPDFQELMNLFLGLP